MTSSDDALSRRGFLKVAAGAGAAGVLGSGARAGAAPRQDGGEGTPPRKPNILIVLSDSHRARNLRCYGDEQVVTPHFDRLAEQGTLLETAVANTPLCRPYRASFMTGSLGHHNGMITNTDPRNFGVDERGQWSPQGLPTLAETFAAAGYRCGYVGKWHLGVVNTAPGPLRFGFNDYWATNLWPSHEYYEWKYATDKNQIVEGEGRFRPAVEVDQVVDYVRDAGDEPWLMMLGWGPPHSPFDPPPRYKNKYRNVELPPNIIGATSEAVARTMLPGYYGLVEAIDTEFGRLVTELYKLGRHLDTIVVYTSDHGNMLASHGLVGKEMPYQEASAVPFIIRWPGKIPAGVRQDMPFGAPDVFPTLAGLAGVDVPGGIDGRDFSRLLLGRPDAPRQDLTLLQMKFCEQAPAPGWRAIRTARHMYAARREEPWLLYDLQEDPWERRNLVDARSPLVAEFEEQLRAEMSRLGDSWT